MVIGHKHIAYEYGVTQPVYSVMAYLVTSYFPHVIITRGDWRQYLNMQKNIVSNIRFEKTIPTEKFLQIKKYDLGHAEKYPIFGIFWANWILGFIL